MPPPIALDKQQQVLTWASAFILGISVGRWIGSWRERRKDSLQGVVSRSSQLIAAWRAVESLELDDGKLFTDELAASLAGPAFAQALAAACPMGPGMDGLPGRRLYKISQVAARTWWFDRQLMTALTSPAVPASKGWLSARLGSSSSRGPSAPPRQVVVLGSGMDSRPWRLPLPPGTRWWEVDRPEVLAVKRRAVRKAGAEVPGEGAVGPTLQLRCEGWAAVGGDVTTDAWVQGLVDAGFDPEKPTVWVLEGLLMYLPQPDADALLLRVAGLSASGSTLIAHALTEEGLAKCQAAAGTRSFGPFPGELSKQWVSCVAKDPSPQLAELGWIGQTACSRAAIAAQICGGDAKGKCDFEETEGGDLDREVVFFVAKRQ